MKQTKKKLDKINWDQIRHYQYILTEYQLRCLKLAIKDKMSYVDIGKKEGIKPKTAKLRAYTGLAGIAVEMLLRDSK